MICPACNQVVPFYGESIMLAAHWVQKGGTARVCGMSLRMTPGPLFQAAKKAYKESMGKEQPNEPA